MLTAARDFVVLVGGSILILFVGTHLLLGGFDPTYWTSSIPIATLHIQRIHVAGSLLCILFLLFVILSTPIRPNK